MRLVTLTTPTVTLELQMSRRVAAPCGKGELLFSFCSFRYTRYTEDQDKETGRSREIRQLVFFPTSPLPKAGLPINKHAP